MTSIDIIKSAFAKQFNVPVEEVTAETTIEQLGGDSLDQIEVIIELEEAFNRALPDSDVEHFRSVGEFHDYLRIV